MSSAVLTGGTKLINVQEFLKRINVAPGQTVADLGCGGGGHFVAPTAALVGSSGLVYALDIQRKVLNSLEASLKIQNIGNVKLVWSNLEEVGAAAIPDASCDVAILANVLFQNTKHEGILRESARIVKNGGLLVIVDWNDYSAPFGPPAQSRVSPHSIKEIAGRIGLSFQDELEVGDYHYALVLRKQ